MNGTQTKKEEWPQRLSVIEEIVDFLLPELTPSETSLYLYLFRHSYLKCHIPKVRVGKRTIATGYGKGIRGKHTDFEHMTTLLLALEKKGCIQIGDTSREGTLYTVRLPQEVSFVIEKLRQVQTVDVERDDFSDPIKRVRIFERDRWTCHYCGEKVTKKNATLDHYIPRSKGGTNDEENLRTCCLVCNGIKSGRTYEEAAADLLGRVRNQRIRRVTSG